MGARIINRRLCNLSSAERAEKERKARAWIQRYHAKRLAEKTRESNPKDPAEMSASEINRRLDQLDKMSSQLTDEFIEAGRGYERPSEIMHQSDPLSLKWRALADEQRHLRIEMQMRAGPGVSRLPRGFGPIRSF